MRKIENHGPKYLWPVSSFSSSNWSCWLKLERLLRGLNCWERFISGCYTITCLWREVGGMHTILLTYETETRLECFWSDCLDSHVFLAGRNGNSVDADLCLTSNSHVDLAAAFRGHPITIPWPKDFNLICPLKLDCALVFEEYSICATFKPESWRFNELLWCYNNRGIGCVPFLFVLRPAWQLFQSDATVKLRSALTCQKAIRSF